MPTLAQLLAICAPLEIIQSNIVSIGLRLKTPRDSLLPLPSMLSLSEQIISPVARRTSGDRLNNPTAWEGIDSDFPLSLLISYSYVIAAGDLMGVSEVASRSLVCMFLLIATGGSHTLSGFGKYLSFTSLCFTEKCNM